MVATELGGLSWVLSLRPWTSKCSASMRFISRWSATSWSEIKPRVTREIIEEHRSRPIGKHSDELERVLIYLRMHHLEMAGKYILVCTKPHEEYRIGRFLGNPGPPELLPETYPDRNEVEHALFVRRLADAGLLPA